MDKYEEESRRQYQEFLVREKNGLETKHRKEKPREKKPRGVRRLRKPYDSPKG